MTLETVDARDTNDTAMASLPLWPDMERKRKRITRVACNFCRQRKAACKTADAILLAPRNS